MADWLKYEVVVPDDGAPGNPEVFEIVTYSDDMSPTLIYRQEGFDDLIDLTVELTTLVTLGELAQAIIDGTAVPVDGDE